jgi:hypothetical protein
MPHAGQLKTEVNATHHKVALSRMNDTALGNRPQSRLEDYAAKTLSALLYGMRLSVLNACILSEPYFGGIAGAYSFNRSGCD